MNKLSWKPIRPLKVRSWRIILSFNSKANDNQLNLIIIQNDKNAIKLNAPIILFLIGSFEPKAWGYQGWKLI